MQYFLCPFFYFFILFYSCYVQFFFFYIFFYFSFSLTAPHNKAYGVLNTCISNFTMQYGFSFPSLFDQGCSLRVVFCFFFVRSSRFFVFLARFCPEFAEIRIRYPWTYFLCPDEALFLFLFFSEFKNSFWGSQKTHFSELQKKVEKKNENEKKRALSGHYVHCSRIR